MFLKNKNIIFKIRRSKVTDYAALNRTRLGDIETLQISWSALGFFQASFLCLLCHDTCFLRLYSKVSSCTFYAIENRQCYDFHL